MGIKHSPPGVVQLQDTADDLDPSRLSSIKLLATIAFFLLLVPFPRLLVHTSVDPVVFQRYSTPYTGLLAGYGALLLATLAGLIALFRRTRAWSATVFRLLRTLRSRPVIFCVLVASPLLIWVVTVDNFQRIEPGRSGWVQLPLLGLAILASSLLWLGGRRDRERFAQWILLALSLSLSLFVLEWTLRRTPSLIPLAVRPHLPGEGMFLRSDLVFEKPIKFGFRYVPNQDRWITYRASDGDLYRRLGSQIEPIRPEADAVLAKTRFVTDEIGYPNQPPLPNRVDVVVAGDSFSAPGVVASAWPDLLEQRTGQSVLNLSMPGYSPRPEVEAVKAFGLDRRPKWVVIAYFEGNDLIIEAPGFEHKRESGLSWIEHDFQHAGPYKSSVALQTLRHGTAALFRWIGRELDELVRDSAPAYRYPLTTSVAGREAKLAFFDPYVSALTADREEIKRSRNLELIAEAFEELARQTRRHGAEPLILYIPSKAHVYLPLLKEDETWRRVLKGVSSVRLAANRYLTSATAIPATRDLVLAHLDDQSAAIESLAKQEGLGYLNLTGVFRARISEGEEPYYLGDTHWNQRGHELVAEVVAGRLQGYRSFADPSHR